MSMIVGVKGREILDSRGNPTVEVDLWLDNGVTARSAVPSGASTGTFEAVELRDGDSRYGGKGVTKAVAHVNEVLGPELLGMDVRDQAHIDSLMLELDGTENKSKVGANATLALSMAVARAAAQSCDLPLYSYLGGIGPYSLPAPMLNVVNGGAHADNSLDIQEFMIMPVGAPTFAEGLRMGTEVYHALKGLLKADGKSTALGDEGGFAPDLGKNADALAYLVKAMEKAGYEPGKDLVIAMDAAASEFYKEGKYHFTGEGRVFSSAELVDYYADLVSRFPIVSIEDGMAEEDWDGFKLLTSRLSNTQIVGDDLFVTNPTRLAKGFELGVCNSILIKLNQIGTVTETMKVISEARRHGYSWVVSHRSGETDDSFISDLAVATAGGQIKTGAPARMDRVAKYNQLLRLEEQLVDAPYAGWDTLKGRVC